MLFPYLLRPATAFVFSSTTRIGDLYNIPWVIQLNGKLDVPALQQSLNAIVARHKSLRTYFVEQDGERFQVIRAAKPFECALITLSAYSQENRNDEIQRILHNEKSL